MYFFLLWRFQAIFQLLLIVMQSTDNKKNDHSLNPDFINGWRPNLTHHQFKQFPIYFTNPSADVLSKSLTSFGINQPYRVVYMGPRHISNLKAFKIYAKKAGEENIVKDQDDMYGENFEKFEFRYTTERQKPFAIRPLQYRLFTGMNPTLKKTDLQFDSNFQCGNLDLAIMVNPSQYDLLMRVDSNTKGHTTWFYFKVTNFHHKQKVKFNLINFQKSGLLYNDGMKPYCFRPSKKQWEQSGTNVTFMSKKFRYSDQDHPIIKKCLSWTYQFSKEDKYVYFAYCVPYSYSYMMHTIKKIQKQNPQIVNINYHHFSTGGLTIPIIHITNPNENENKATCMAIARLHPGETQGSWMMDGFLKFICSAKAHSLREKVVFRIVPMVNVDGVVLGNFRTSIVGRDINRFFHRPDQYEEVALIRTVAQKNNPLIFLDFHGHSTKRNAFMYGPNYSLDHRHYLTSRLLPKIISKMSDAFRYYSCIFKISACKIHTSRAIMMKNVHVTFPFTIQASSHGYGPKIQDKIFDRDGYRSVGEKIGQSLDPFVSIIFKLPKRQEIKQQKQVAKSKQRVRTTIKSPQKQNKKSKKPVFQSNLFNFDKSILEALSDDKQLLQQLLKDEQKRSQENDKSDGSASDSDFEQGCDYSDKELLSMMKSDGSDEALKVIKSVSKKKKKTIDELQRSKQVRSPIKDRASKILKKQKSLETLQKVSPHLPREKVQRKMKVISVQQLQPPVMPASKSSILNISTAFQGMEDSDCVLNKVHYRNWKKFSDPFASQVQPYFDFNKMKPVNQINLSYCDEGEQYDEFQKQRQKRKQMNLRDRRAKKKIPVPRERQSISKKQIKVEQVFYVKEPMLPVLNRNSFNERKSNISFLEQLLEKSSNKVEKNYVRKNLKILHF